MISIETARSMALSLPQVAEKAHFQLPDFRVGGKIFASLHTDKQLMMVKLPVREQSVFCAFDETVIFPVPGGWGRKGATFINLKKVKKAMLMDALQVAWKHTASKKTAAADTIISPAKTSIKNKRRNENLQ
jgi:hypothetical protein